MNTVRGQAGAPGMHVEGLHGHFYPDRPFRGSRLLMLVAAGVAGTFLTFLLMVSLPSLKGGASRPALLRYHEQRRAQAVSGEFSLVGPFRVSPHSVAFSWTSPADPRFRSYEVHYSATSPFTPSALTLYAQPVTTQSATSIEVPNLQCATTYFFKVRVNYQDGRFIDSSELLARTGACPDSLLTYGPRHDQYGMAADSLGYGDDASGAAPDSGYAGDGSRYSWYSRWDSSLASHWRSSDSTGNAATDPGMTRPSASGDDGTPQGAAPDNGRDATGQAATLFPPAFVTDNSGDIVWSENYSDQFRSYQVHVSTTPGFRPSAATLRQEFTSRYRSRFHLEGLACGSVYYVKVRDVLKSGWTFDSNEVALRTLPCDSTSSRAGASTW